MIHYKGSGDLYRGTIQSNGPDMTRRTSGRLGAGDYRALAERKLAGLSAAHRDELRRLSGSLGPLPAGLG